MKRKIKRRRLVRGSMIISTISVTLVLVILGIVALTSITAHRATESVRANIGFVALVDDKAPQQSVDSLEAVLRSAPYVSELKYRTADEVLEHSKTLIDSSLLVPGINPFLPEYDVKVKAQWANPDSLNSIKTRLEGMTAVYEDVKVQADMASNVNLTIHSVIMALLIVAGVMLLISFVLINNTVRMEVYAQRMVIHTMQYVGATRCFIRRPYIVGSVVSGLVAAVLASALLALILVGIDAHYTPVLRTVTWGYACLVFVALAVVGAVLCALASWLATSKYLRKNYDEIFD